MNQPRVTTKHRRRLRLLQDVIDAATDPRSPGGTAIIACEMPEIVEGLAGAHAEAAVIELTDDLRGTSPERLEPKLAELLAWSERLPAA